MLRVIWRATAVLFVLAGGLFLGVAVVAVFTTAPQPSQSSGDAQAATSPAEPAPQPAEAGCHVTLGGYRQLYRGISYEEAVGVLGCSGEEVSCADLAGLTTVIYEWQGGFISNMNATFQNDRLISKAQLGLGD